MPGTRTPVIALEDIGLPGRVTREMYAPRRVRKSISVADVYPQDPVSETPTRSVSGAWLAGVLALEPELAAELAGREVTVEEDAWFAVQASVNAGVRWRSQQRLIAKRRARHWPEEEQQQEKGAAKPGDNGPQDGPACRCLPTVWVGARYVDSENGDDDNSGTVGWGFGGPDGSLGLGPWKTLCRVERWLNRLAASGACIAGAQVLLRRGRTWTGLEEPGERSTSPCSGSSGAKPVPWEDKLPTNTTTHHAAALTVVDFKATGGTHLFISAYGPELTGALDNRPVIDGSSARTTGARYDRKEFGLLFYNCCHVYVSDLRVRGFKTAIHVRSGSKHHIYENVSVYDNARSGFDIGVSDRDVSAATAAEIDNLIALGLYPANIAVVRCQAESNGYDTEGGDIELGFLATNCTISENTLTGGGPSYNGQSVRGIDGIVSQGGSSGHLIEKNRIYGHVAWCRTTSKQTTVTQGLCGSTTDWTISQPCYPGVPTLPRCDWEPDLGLWVRTAFETASGRAAFGEDGIDLKGVRKRTPDAKDETIVCDNVIWGHTSHGYTGITVNDGSKDIYIFRNKIFQNSVGIHITNSKSTGWYRNAESSSRPPTEGVYIYRNLVYMNEEHGVFIEGGELSPSSVGESRGHVSLVYLVNNTIAHNLWSGVYVLRYTGRYASPADLEKVYLNNNLIARNGIGGTEDEQSFQVAWSPNVDLSEPLLFGSDFNCYLGWSGDTGEVILWDSTSLSVEIAQDDWHIEGGGVQAAELSAVHLSGYAEFIAVEGAAGFDLADNVGALLDAATVEGFGLGYDVVSTLSACYRTGRLAAGPTQPQSGDDIVESVDINGDMAYTLSPSIGAFEGPL